MKHTGRLGIFLFMLLYLPTILLLSSRIGGAVAPVIGQAYLIGALIVGLTYYVTKNKIARLSGDAEQVSNPSLGSALLLIGISFGLLVGLGVFVGVPIERGSQPSIFLQGMALGLIFVATLACQAIAAFASGGPVGLFGRLASSNDTGALQS